MITEFSRRDAQQSSQLAFAVILVKSHLEHCANRNDSGAAAMPQVKEVL